eukprot:1556234-Karenia_brevis.AAC.1
MQCDHNSNFICGNCDKKERFQVIGTQTVPKQLYECKPLSRAIRIMFKGVLGTLAADGSKETLRSLALKPFASGPTIAPHQKEGMHDTRWDFAP